ncbi:MAG: hypothetical protein LBU60_03960 [Clostridiales bacterium]|jgi:hypothetical protein|nr:hypothetical protein [Clostridiales bacterium]
MDNSKLQELLQSIQEPYNPSIIEEKVNLEIEKDYEKIKEDEKGKRQKYYTDLLGNYVALNNFKKTYRHITYWLVFGVFLFSFIVMSVFLIKAFNRGEIEKIITASASLLLAIIAMPLIILKYLFPQTDNSAMEKIVEHLVNLDKE